MKKETKIKKTGRILNLIGIGFVVFSIFYTTLNTSPTVDVLDTLEQASSFMVPFFTAFLALLFGVAGRHAGDERLGISVIIASIALLVLLFTLFWGPLFAVLI